FIDWTVDTNGPTVTVPTTGLGLGCNPQTLPTDASVAAQVTASDSCSAVTTNVTHLDSTNGCIVTRTFTVGVTDACTNTTTKTVAYTWTADTTPPQINCQPAKTVVLGTTWAFDDPTSPADACGTNRVEILNTVSNVLCGRSYSLTRTWKATDPCNNTNTCSQTVTVVDTNPPALTLSQNCSPSIIENGQTVTFTGIVTNTGTMGLTNIVVKDLLANAVVTNLPYLGPGASIPFS